MVIKARLPSLLSNPALTDDQNLVCSDYRGQPLTYQNNSLLKTIGSLKQKEKRPKKPPKNLLIPVGYDDCCTICAHFSQRSLDVSFRLRVERRCGLQRKHHVLAERRNSGKSYSLLWSFTSSRRMICGALRIVLAMATLCFSPPLSFRPLSPTCVS